MDDYVGVVMFEVVVNLSIVFNLNLYLLGFMYLYLIYVVIVLFNYWGVLYFMLLFGGFMFSVFFGNYWIIIVVMFIEFVVCIFEN